MLTVKDKNSSGLQKTSDLDVLFLYRTDKKKRYFTSLKEHLSNTLTCEVHGYHALPSVYQKNIETQQLKDIVFKAEQELYNAKDESWQTVKIFLRPLLIAQIKNIYSRLFSFLTEKQPKCLAIWNGHKWQDNVLHAVNIHFNIPIVYFENGVLPNSTTMDFRGINALNSVPRAAGFYQRLAQTESEYSDKIVGRQYKRKNKSKNKKTSNHKKLKKPDFSLPEKYLLIPFQKDRDSQILDNSRWIKSMRQLFYVLVDALELSGRRDLQLVFREHPSAKTKYSSLHKLAAKHPRVCFDQQSDLSDIITRAQAVVTVNSTVGLESLLLNTKVITLGDAFYNIHRLVLRAASTSELATQINTLEHFTPAHDLLQKFVTYLEHEYVIPGNWKTPDNLHFQRIEQRFLVSMRHKLSHCKSA